MESIHCFIREPHTALWYCEHLLLPGDNSQQRPIEKVCFTEFYVAGAGDMAQLLVPRTKVTEVPNTNSKGSTAIFWLSQAQGTHNAHTKPKK